MPRAFTAEVVIDRAPDVVWRTLTNWMLAPKWMAGIDALIPNGPNRVGTKLKFTARGQGGYSSEITAYDKVERLSLRSEQDGVVADYTYLLHGMGEQTRVTLEARCVVETGFFSHVPRLLHVLMWLSDGSQLKKLKKLIEK